MRKFYADNKLQRRGATHSPAKSHLPGMEQKKKLFGVSLFKLALSKITSLLILLLLLAPETNAQQATDYAVQANIIYHFTKYIDWPGYKKSGDFIIGII